VALHTSQCQQSRRVIWNSNHFATNHFTRAVARAHATK